MGALSDSEPVHFAVAQHRPYAPYLASRGRTESVLVRRIRGLLRRSPEVAKLRHADRRVGSSPTTALVVAEAEGDHGPLAEPYSPPAVAPGRRCSPRRPEIVAEVAVFELRLGIPLDSFSNPPSRPRRTGRRSPA